MIDDITLTNFKSFRDLRIPLGSLTLLTGLNSSGKSSVLQAIAALRQSSTLHAEYERRGLLLNGSLTELGTGRDVLHSDWVENAQISSGPYVRIRLSGPDSSQEWIFDYVNDADVLPLLHTSSTPSAERTYPDPGTALLFGPPGAFQYLRADRVSPAATYERSHESAVQMAFLGPHGEHTVNYLRHYQRTPVTAKPLRHQGVKSSTLLSQVQAWLGEISPGVHLDAAGIDGTDLVRLSYGFGGRAGLSSSDPRRPTNVGFGLTYTLPIIVACLSAKPGTLLMLENPEAHLHPRGQTQIAFLMARAARAGAQLIVETHSDHVLNGLRLAVKDDVLPHSDVVLHYFRNQGTGPTELTSPAIGPDGMLSEWPDGFFDEWDNAVMRLLG